MTIEAANDSLWVIREIPENEKGGIMIPDAAKKPVHRGKIITRGNLVSDPIIKDGATAVFNKSAGWEMEQDGVTYLVLNQIDIVSII